MNFEIREVSYKDKALLEKVLFNLVFLKSDYPNFHPWFKETVESGMKAGNRYIYIAVPSESQDEIAGVLILKDTPYEKKISTLCVMNKFRRNGLGTKLIELAIDKFGGVKPLITVSNNHVNEFEALFRKYRFNCFEQYPDYYVDGLYEFSYNGYLTSSQNSIYRDEAC